MPAGRPTTYDPAYCDKVIELGGMGASKHEMALEIGCAYSTFQLWQTEHPEFSAAVKMAADGAQGWWERNGRLRTFAAGPDFNATSFIFNMKNRFPDDWRDKQERELSGEVKVGHIERTIVDPKNPANPDSAGVPAAAPAKPV